MQSKTERIKEIVEQLKNEKVGVLPTDTLYGLVGSALSEKVVERIYKLKKRSPKKPMIILISSFRDLKLFEVKVKKQTQKLLRKFWPGEISIVLPCPSERFSYLHRDTKKLAFRLPQPKWLRELLRKTGPLVAPSANPESLPPAETVRQARKYFGNKIDFYAEGGKIGGLPSTLIEIENGNITLKREGQVKI